MDVGRTEAADVELVRMIARRSRQGDADPDEQSELWRQSVARYNASRSEENRRAWAAFHEGQAERHRRTLTGLIADHEEKAHKLLADEVRGEGGR